MKAHAFFDHVARQCGFKSDAQMASALDITPQIISKIRHGKHAISNYMIVLAHEATGDPIAQLRILARLPEYILRRKRA